MRDDSQDLRLMLEQIRRFCVVNIRWLTRGVILAVALVITLHQVYAPSVEWIGELLGMAKPSLASLLVLVALVLIIERVVVLEELVSSPPVTVDARRVDALKRLADLVQQHGAGKVAMLQVSGYTVLHILRQLAERWPRAEVRLLLMKPEAASRFDNDHKPDHRDRILTSVREVELILGDYPGFRVETKFYDTPPGISAVIVDDELVSISWYFCYREPATPDVVRLRGHLAPTLTAVGDDARSLLSFARGHFDTLWKTAADAPE